MKGKKLTDYVARTFSCWGDGRTHVEGMHYSLPTALRQFARLVQYPYRVNQRRLFTSMPNGYILWSTDDLSVPPENAPARVVIRDVVKAMRGRMVDHYPHNVSCSVKFDQPCNCYRGELLALIAREEVKENPEPFRKIRRSSHAT